MTDPSATPPLVSLDDGVLSIRIATPAGGNVLDGNAMSEGAAALADLDDSVGAVLLVGAEANFCAGGNVRAFHSAPDRSAFVRSLAESFHDFVRALTAVPVPVIAGVPGWAAGAGMSLVCHVDIAIGGRSTRLRPAYPALGFTPDGGLTWALPRIVGIRRARDILLNDSVLGSDEAFRLGLLTRLVGDDVIASEAERLARSLAAGPTSVTRATKRLLLASDSATLSDQLDAETDSISAMASTPNGIEGVDAFVEKRRPSFGR
ncbi:enoyl-CoA hydratase/isomerase family protein [Rhodococcus sp. MEB064]|uniref:enoyl-CoA hydratase/isomerase family protein n=1 Tax=Rhodococcus sp. MEB064 TaxID=1587522 RepID=UPI0005ABC481|nr:enoyl-CoA hydratase-related protein [Rhodococcus sp. MEB064]KIQ08205.1 enoyl-CoA hydratase [Rhodococcus sp. MEB064]